jgi:hypothetical protein
MKSTRIAMLAAMGLLSSAMLVSAEEPKPQAWGGVVVGKLTMTAVVQKVDPATREVTLKDSEGVTTTVVAGPLVRNFDQIKKGDHVAVQYQESVSIVAMAGLEAEPQRAESVDVTRAPLGEKPAGSIVKTDEVLADVTAINQQERTVTLKGPKQSVTVHVDEKVKSFERLKVGDKVHLRVTQSLAVEVKAQ